MVRVALLLALFLSSPAFSRTFTNQAGKSLEAEIVRATATTVTLRMNNTRTATIKIATLSEKDQEYVTEWLADQIPRLRFDPKMVRSSKKSKSSSYYSSYSSTVQNIAFSVEVKNEDNAKGLEETTMKYYLIGRHTGKPNVYKILLVQSEDFTVPAAGSHTVRFRKAINTYYSGSRTYGNNYKCVGYAVYAERKSDQREVYTFGSMPQIKDAIYSITTLKQGDVTDDKFLKPEAPARVQPGRVQPGGNPQPNPPRRPGNPSPLNRPVVPEEAPIRIR